MKKKQDPNKEVERWKDAFYEKIKNLSKDQLIRYLENTAGRIQKNMGYELRI